MSTFFTVFFYPLKLLFEAEPNSILRAVFLIACIVWYFFLFSLGQAIWHALPLFWAFVVWVVKGLWAAYQWVMQWLVPPMAVMHFLSWSAAESRRPGQLQAQSDKLMDWVRDHVSTKLSSVQHSQAEAEHETARIIEAVNCHEDRLAKLEPIPIEAIQSMDGVMQQFVKGGDA